MTASSLIWMDYCSRSEISLFCFNKGLSQVAIIWRWSQSKAIIYILMHCIQELITHFTEREVIHCRAQSFHVGQFPSNSHSKWSKWTVRRRKSWSITWPSRRPHELCYMLMITHCLQLSLYFIFSIAYKYWDVFTCYVTNQGLVHN